MTSRRTPAASCAAMERKCISIRAQEQPPACSRRPLDSRGPLPEHEMIRIPNEFSICEIPMKIGSQQHHASAISSSNERVILVRGRDLCAELIGHISFTDHIWLLITG